MLGNELTFRGYVRSDLMPAVYQSADIFVAPRYGRNPSEKVVVEAMACGLPVIASNRGGFRRLSVMPVSFLILRTCQV